MKHVRSWRRAALAAGLLLSTNACGTRDELDEEQAGALASRCQQPPAGAEKDDTDGDGLDDNFENCLLEARAPIVFFSWGENKLPANVDWLLDRSRLVFRHARSSFCSYCNLVSAPRQANVASFQHEMKLGAAFGCAHQTGNWVDITRAGVHEDEHYYVHLTDEAQGGSRNTDDWRTYGHVYPNDFGGADVQYWFTYGYSDGIAWDNHQGDWEMVTARLDRKGEVVDVVMCAHEKCQEFHPSQVQFTDGHMHTYVAEGTHAMYPDRERCDQREKNPPKTGGSIVGKLGVGCPPGARTWFPGADRLPLVNGQVIQRAGDIRNVGERKYPLYGQRFIQGNFKWGAERSAPATPTFQEDRWHLKTRVAEPAGGQGGGGSCDDSCTAPMVRQEGNCGTCVCSEESVKACDEEKRNNPGVRRVFTADCSCQIDDG